MLADEAWRNLLATGDRVSLSAGISVKPTELTRDGDEGLEDDPCVEVGGEMLLEFVIELAPTSLLKSRRGKLRSSHYDGWVALRAEETFEESLGEIQKQVRHLLEQGDGPPIDLEVLRQRPIGPPQDSNDELEGLKFSYGGVGAVPVTSK